MTELTAGQYTSMPLRGLHITMAHDRDANSRRIAQLSMLKSWIKQSTKTRSCFIT